MAHSFPYRYGDTEPRDFKTNPGDIIWGGDLIYYDGTNGDAARSAAELVNGSGSTLAGTFIGVAMSSSLDAATSWSGSGEDHLLACATTGVFEFTVAALGADVEQGTLVGGADGATNMDPKAVATGVAATAAIGKVVRHASAGDTTVWVEIQSWVHRDGYSAV